MPRGLTTAVKTELATGKIRPVLLIEIGFSTPIYLTDASFDITSSVSGSSRTYLSNGHLQNISNINETNVPTKNTLSIKLFKKSLGIVTNILCIIDDITNIYSRWFLISLSMKLKKL